MAFSNYKNLAFVMKNFQIKYEKQNYIKEIEFTVKQDFKDELELLFIDGVIDNSEYAICENLIYPVLKEVWKSYRHKLTLWSHQTLFYDEDLSGIPDYMVTKRHPVNLIICEQPYFLVVEAKQDKFEEGWGQCLAEMIAVQKLNQTPEKSVFGIVCNGEIWQFGKLHLDVFTKNKKNYQIQELEELFAAVNFIFQQCDIDNL